MKVSTGDTSSLYKEHRITVDGVAAYTEAQLKAYGAAEYQRGTEALQEVTAERDALKVGIEKLASEILGPELYANSPCQASDFELVSIYVKDLHKERDALKAIADSDDGAGGEGMKLYLENRALKADAERYRWLFGARTAEQASHPDVGMKPPLPQDLVLAELSSFYCHKEAVDQIITAAMKGTS